MAGYSQAPSPCRRVDPEDMAIDGPIIITRIALKYIYQAYLASSLPIEFQTSKMEKHKGYCELCPSSRVDDAAPK
jgi:hypothetical protein